MHSKSSSSSMMISLEVLLFLDGFEKKEASFACPGSTLFFLFGPLLSPLSEGFRFALCPEVRWSFILEEEMERVIDFEDGIVVLVGDDAVDENGAGG